MKCQYTLSHLCTLHNVNITNWVLFKFYEENIVLPFSEEYLYLVGIQLFILLSFRISASKSMPCEIVISQSVIPLCNYYLVPRFSFPSYENTF